MAELRQSIRMSSAALRRAIEATTRLEESRASDGLERELQRLVTSSRVTNRDRLGLTDLESAAKVYHSIYDSFLQRYGSDSAAVVSDYRGAFD